MSSQRHIRPDTHTSSRATCTSSEAARPGPGTTCPNSAAARPGSEATCPSSETARLDSEAPHQSSAATCANSEATHPSKRISAGAKAAHYGILVALALVAGYIEMLIPAPVPIPGIKLGLGNLVVLVTLVRMGTIGALAVTSAKAVLSSILFGNPQIMLFSLVGALLSWLVMALAYKSRMLSCISISVLGGVAHNAGQLMVVALLLTPQVALGSAPLLAASGMLAGAAIGIIAHTILAALPQQDRWSR
ncbi:Gx transporter family protein [Collinsella sp. AGMB00827]|uniref:Gx transporter family protein n=1 Tax=Collinsella ureilytica TaxID=2869515 RepID=A0ABS7MJW1_9ACTN|nr:Gx transporter family protein [Collinsella urealyticum]MBY4797567.1 Gx transporter family protein [Collinsella urealyticum]